MMSRRRAAGFAMWITVAVGLLACGSGATLTTPPSTSDSGTSGGATPPQPSPYANATAFTSPLYHYTLTFPAGWTIIPATVAWDGTSDLGHDVPQDDQLQAPAVTGRCKTVFICGPVAWAYAAPTTKSLADVVAAQDLDAATYHQCTARPPQENLTLAGDAAVLEVLRCPATDGIPVWHAVTIHDGVQYQFTMQDSSNDPSAEPADRADFLALLATLRFGS